jgi:hypothetical protein
MPIVRIEKPERQNKETATGFSISGLHFYVTLSTLLGRRFGDSLKTASGAYFTSATQRESVNRFV